METHQIEQMKAILMKNHFTVRDKEPKRIVMETNRFEFWLIAFFASIHFTKEYFKRDSHRTSHAVVENKNVVIKGE